ncbi:MAG TPA: alcohol dehydrogenase [Acidimicrobiaceae bacterium]|nr:alcohol dehydrogenase [Acidimicrobiaceae bacterium]HIM84188.1 alcohol dehydrogenase [Acidimicrobiia bacterium]
MTSPTTCRAVVFNGDGTWDLRHDFRVPEPPPGGAVLAVEAVGLCHSDVSQLNGHKHVPGEVSPTVPGHEIVGRVQSLGADADLGVAVGDRVAVNIITFGEPYEGNPFGVRCYGYSFGLDEAEGLWGGYGEYMSILPGTQLVRLTDDISAEELTLFEPLSNMVNWLGQAGFRAGMSIVIQGPGHMGLTCAAYARHLGAGMVIVTGTADDATRLDTARRIGADHTIDVTVDDPVEAVMDLSGGFGVSVAVDLASATATPGLCLDLVHHGGRVVWAGLKDNQVVPVVSDKVVTRSLTIHGGAGGTNDSMAEACRILNEDDFPTGLLLGEVVDLDGIDHAMDLLDRTAETDAVRAVLKHG